VIRDVINSYGMAVEQQEDLLPGCNRFMQTNRKQNKTKCGCNFLAFSTATDPSDSSQMTCNSGCFSIVAVTKRRDWLNILDYASTKK